MSARIAIAALVAIVFLVDFGSRRRADLRAVAGATTNAQRIATGATAASLVSAKAITGQTVGTKSGNHQ